MTTKEHELMILMFARMYQAIGALGDVLKSREIMTEEDLRAFLFAAWADEKSTRKHVAQAQSDYRKAAKLSGVADWPET